ncbi:hypothetical protein D1872_351100 [compost metagenome]
MCKGTKGSFPASLCSVDTFTVLSAYPFVEDRRSFLLVTVPVVNGLPVPASLVALSVCI